MSDSAVSPSLVPPGDGDRLGSPSSPPEATEPHQLAGLTFDELTFAAAVVANYAATLPRQSRAVLCTTDELHELAARLTAAANVAPTP
ncbi:MAG: hypothetical protein PGN37_20375 [Mycobacterium kyogaense]|uniref:hypothetical protein n=1 Tax=Mycobacterium kyogaense TaxID=2212479 RepID=UPI002FF617A4